MQRIYWGRLGWAIKAGSETGCELGLAFDLGPMEPMGNSHGNPKELWATNFR